MLLPLRPSRHLSGKVREAGSPRPGPGPGLPVPAQLGLRLRSESPRTAGRQSLLLIRLNSCLLPPTPAPSLSWVRPGSPSLPANGTTAHLSGSRLAFLELGHVSGVSQQVSGFPSHLEENRFPDPQLPKAVFSKKRSICLGRDRSCLSTPPPTLQKSCTCFTFLDLSNRQGVKASGRGEEEPIKKR